MKFRFTFSGLAGAFVDFAMTGLFVAMMYFLATA